MIITVVIEARIPLALADGSVKLGWNHDVGYEFTEKQSEHLAISADMYLNFIAVTKINDQQDMIYQAIKYHGHYTENKTEEWKILTSADMLIDSKGNEVDVMERLSDIRERYGEHSEQYITACDVCYQIGLTAVNLAANIC